MDALRQLTSLAEEHEIVSRMRWARFDTTLVDEIQASTISWVNSNLQLNEGIPEEEMQQQRDKYHCSEAWRYGLLIYIERVFRWDRKSSPPAKLTIYARLIIEHVHSCRHTTIVQKQTFLPLFFAGCETQDRFSRESIRNYCSYWSKSSGYDLFNTALLLLEDLWLEQDLAQGGEVWWGSIIDKKQQFSQPDSASKQFCFG